ncbi:DUF4303 domain-containing protein [Actinosynnema pretiosum subsp. pretiosum]
MLEAVVAAVRSAWTDLRRGHREDWYYVTLTTSGEGERLALTAWSEQALARVGDEGLRWSYADSPYCAWGEEWLAGVRFPRGDPDAVLEVAVEALAVLDAEGAFGTGAQRASLLLAAEVMPPDHTNTARVLRLNRPSVVLERWLAEAAE